jgi:hypothetical protein
MVNLLHWNRSTDRCCGRFSTGSRAALKAVALTVLTAVMIFSPQPQGSAWGCTIAVVSGRVTADKRPLLWKNRDTDTRNNEVRHLEGGPLECVAVVNTDDPERVWMGMNEAGFCIENSLAKDLPGGSAKGRGNGRFMKLALQTCRTIADFEKLLEQTNVSGRRTLANFGVIDAAGGACLFEAGHKSYVKFDANDPQDAPHGYIVRSNFAMTASGKKARELGGFTKIYSGRRYVRADALLRQELEKHGRLDFRFFLRQLSRDLAVQPQALNESSAALTHFLSDGSDEAAGPPAGNGDVEDILAGIIDTRATINRYNTVSAAVFVGVKEGEQPDLTTMWAMLGEPVFSVAVPCWVGAGVTAPALLNAGSIGSMCTAVFRVRQENYDDESRTLKTTGLTRIWDCTFTAENNIVERTSERLDHWREETPDADTMVEFHRSMAGLALKAVLDAGRRTTHPAVAEAAAHDVRMVAEESAQEPVRTAKQPVPQHSASKPTPIASTPRARTIPASFLHQKP